MLLSPTRRTRLIHTPRAVRPLAALLLLGLATTAGAQSHRFDRASHVILPQSRAFSFNPARQPIVVEGVQARVKIVESTAQTTLDIALRNPGRQQSEAVILIPVPDGAVISQFLFQGSAPEGTAEVLRRDEARRFYDEIVARIKDPALLEFAGYNLIRSSVFPVPPGGTQKVRVTYENILEKDGNRIDYRLPRSESLNRSIPWEIGVEIVSNDPISMIYSPTHDLSTISKDARRAVVRSTREAATSPGPFLLSYLLERDGVSASLLAYPDPTVGGGYFLLMAGLPADLGKMENTIRREVTVVIDRSGSMAGEKMDQALASVRQVLEGLADGEAFSIIDYSSTVESFSVAPVIKDREQMLKARAYLDRIRPGGGTNIHDALLTALRQKPAQGMLPIILFLTDGLPTIGRTAETDIRALLEKGNEYRRRVFTVGVGSDVNAPLLDRVSELSRASSTFVLAGEDVELKVARVFKKLYGPVLSDPELTAADDSGQANTRLIRELMPTTLPDLFEGDELILLGQYTGRKPVTFRLTGNFLGRPRNFEFRFDFAGESVKNSFVPRLWASRRIAFLIDQIRQAGGEIAGQPRPIDAALANDPRFKELIDEILALSTKFGILTEYTAFLAREGTNLDDWSALRAMCNDNIDKRAVFTRSGVAGVNQSLNFNHQKVQSKLNYRNRFWDENLERVEIATVQQVCDRAFFRRGDRWIDSRVLNQAQGTEAGSMDVIQFGSDAHKKLVEQFVLEGRQSVLSLEGEILIPYGKKNILIQNRPQR